MIFVKGAVELIVALARDKLDLHRALTSALGARRGGRECHFLNCVNARTDVGEEPVGGLESVVLHVDTVCRNVERAFRQSINRRGAWTAWRGCAWQKKHQVERVARRKWQFGDLTSGNRRGDVG